MNITLLTTTECNNVLEYIGEIAGVCYGKDDANEGRALRCWKYGHESVFEHFSATWKIEGISRACSHQLVRHRMASYTQQSLRYTEADDSYYPPDLLSGFNAATTKEAMGDVFKAYKKLLDNGVKMEDARYILPMATTSDIFVTMNLREFLKFYELRSSNRAQDEIRELSYNMMMTLQSKFPEIGDLLDTNTV